MKNVYTLNGEPIATLARLSDHTWSVLGDSISTEGAYVNKHYWDFIQERYNNLTTYIYGQHGHRISDFVGRYNVMHYSDVITVFGGINDFGGNVPLGTDTDSSTDTFYGSMNLLCEGLLSTFPQSLIIFITPLGNNNSPYIPYNITNSLGLTIYDYSDAMKYACERHKIPVIDACSKSLLNPYVNAISTLYFVDGLHLNVSGHEVLSYMVEEEMLSHYIPTITSN